MIYQVVEDLVAQSPNDLERLSRRDGVDEHVAVNANDMLRAKDTVFVLDRGGNRWSVVQASGSIAAAGGRLGQLL